MHFHCHGGDGRTTTFLAMYDMFCWAMAGKKLSRSKNSPTGNGAFSAIAWIPRLRKRKRAEGEDCKENTGWKSALACERWHGFLNGTV